MAHEFRHDAPLTESEDLLDPIDLRCAADMAATRVQAAWRTRVAIAVRAADAVLRETLIAEVHTSELRRNGATCVAPKPLMVGSLFHLAFDRGQIDLAPALALCDRCTMLGDSAFEVRFKFVQDVDIAFPRNPQV